VKGNEKIKEDSIFYRVQIQIICSFTKRKKALPALKNRGSFVKIKPKF
jgi:hypothetical protein